MDTAGAQSGVGPVEMIPEPDDLAAGAAVQVRNRFDGRWVSGFLVAGVEAGGFLVSRCSGGGALPLVFPATDVRRS